MSKEGAQYNEKKWFDYGGALTITIIHLHTCVVICYILSASWGFEDFRFTTCI